MVVVVVVDENGGGKSGGGVKAGANEEVGKYDGGNLLEILFQ